MSVARIWSKKLYFRAKCIMGKNVGFYVSSRLTGIDLKSENQVSHLAIIYIKVDIQISKLVNNDTNMAKMAHKCTVDLSTKRRADTGGTFSSCWMQRSISRLQGERNP